MAKEKPSQRELSRSEKLKLAAKNVLKGSSHAIKITHLGVRTLQTLGVPLPFIAPAVAGLNALADLSEVREVEEALNKVTDGDLEGIADLIDHLDGRLDKEGEKLANAVIQIQEEIIAAVTGLAEGTRNELLKLEKRGESVDQEISSTLVEVCKLLNDTRRSTEEIMGEISEKLDGKFELLERKINDGFAETNLRLEHLPDAIVSRLDEREKRLGGSMPEFGPKGRAMRVIFIQFDDNKSSHPEPSKHWFNKFGFEMKKELERMSVEFKYSKMVAEDEEHVEDYLRQNAADLVVWGYLADNTFKVVYTNGFCSSFKHICFYASDNQNKVRGCINRGVLVEKMIYFAKALAMRSKRDAQGAYKLLTQAIGLEGIDCSAFYYFRALTSIELGDFEEESVLRDVEEMYRLDLDCEDLYFYVKGNISERIGDKKQALDNYHKAVGLSKRKDIIESALRSIGDIHCKLKKFGKAIEYYDKALRIDRDTLTLLNHGKAKMERGLLREAVDDFTEVIGSKNCDYGSLIDKQAAYQCRSVCYRRLHEYEKAEKDAHTFILIA